jgi:hypothetical protein
MPSEPQVICNDRTGRRLLLAGATLNGIDYIEVPWDDQKHVRVYFMKAPLPESLTASQVSIEGGVRIQDIKVEGSPTTKTDDGVDYLEVTVNHAGDFSIYTLAIDAPGVLDPQFSRLPFSFKAGCPSDFDCAAEEVCPPKAVEDPLIDYLAKDYASFRQLLIDLIPTKVPEWRERHEADLGIALIELLAYVADNLSYYQDAVANEAFLETARQRESVRRHVKLIDYPMHDGANARAFVHFQVSAKGTIPQGTTILVRIDQPVEPGSIAPPGAVIDSTAADRALDVAPAVFEVMAHSPVDPHFNKMAIHVWGDAECCLPRGATTVDLVGERLLQAGDALLLEEVKGTATGLPQDADPHHRQIVRLVEVTHTEDRLMTLDPSGRPTPRAPGNPALPVTRVTWDAADALTFPLCLSTVLQDGKPVSDCSVARGNIVLADHGRTIEEEQPAHGAGIRTTNVAYRVRLNEGPLTFRATRRALPGDPPPSDAVRSMLDLAPRGAEPQVSAEVKTIPAGDTLGKWWPVPDLLDSDPFEQRFVVETDNAGRASLRFGDDDFGQAAPDGTTLHVTYRVGNGAIGNVGRESLVHCLEPQPLPLKWPSITALRNPLPAWGGIDPESLEQVRRLAPAAFHAQLYRAVTEEDYARATEKLAEVSHAAATFRWTGSWHTVSMAIDPAGGDELTPELEDLVRAFLTRYKQAAYDLEIDPPIYVPLKIGVTVCVAPSHFRGDVKKAVLEALSNRTLADGRRGFFHPDNFTFGQSLYLSQLYAALEAVEGVDSAEVTTFERFGKEPNGELERGSIETARLEVIRLDNDPNFPENGLLSLQMLGGK